VKPQKSVFQRKRCRLSSCYGGWFGTSCKDHNVLGAVFLADYWARLIWVASLALLQHGRFAPGCRKAPLLEALITIMRREK